MNLDEALQTLIGVAQAAKTPELQTTPVGARRMACVLGGEIVDDIIIDTMPCQRTASSIGAMLELAERFGGDKPTIYVGTDKAVLVLDDSDRQEVVRLNYTASEPLLSLLSLETGVTQRSLVSTLRTSLATSCTYDQIVSVFRNLQFNRRNDGTSTIEHGRESLGKEIESLVQSKGEPIPEELVFRIPLYCTPDDISSEAEIRVAVEIDAENERISFTNMDDCVTRERQRVQREIRDRIMADSGEDVVAVCGGVSMNDTDNQK